jgi:hypothetical protein
MERIHLPAILGNECKVKRRRHALGSEQAQRRAAHR